MPNPHDLDQQVRFVPIGVIHTPYTDWAPYQSVEREEGIGRFKVVIEEKYRDALKDLDRFRYIILLFYLDRAKGAEKMSVSPPWAKGRQVGLFASRTPNRPNAIGLSVVRLVKIEGNVIYTWPIDALDGTPLLDIKPYIRDLDSKPDADYGWFGDVGDAGHLLDHVRGVPHAHDHQQDHHHHPDENHS